MNLKQILLGIVLFIVFWAFQMKYFASLGTAEWFLGVLIFGLILWAIGKVSVPKQSESFKLTFNFAFGIALVIGVIVSFVPPSYLGVVFPPNFTPDQLTPLLLSCWLIIFGARAFITGWEEKWNITMFTGLLWLFVATHLYTLGSNAYFLFGIIVSLPFVIYGLLAKD